jgi:hypothetical protein
MGPKHPQRYVMSTLAMDVIISYCLLPRGLTRARFAELYRERCMVMAREVWRGRSREKMRERDREYLELAVSKTWLSRDMDKDSPGYWYWEMVGETLGFYPDDDDPFPVACRDPRTGARLAKLMSSAQLPHHGGRG